MQFILKTYKVSFNHNALYRFIMSKNYVTESRLEALVAFVQKKTM